MLAAILIVAVALALGMARRAHGAQVVCDQRPVIIELMARKYGEVVTWRALTVGGSVMEILQSENGRTWTAIVTTTSGVACLIAAGTDAESLIPQRGPRT